MLTTQAVVLFARSPEREAASKRMPHSAPLFRRVAAAWLRAIVSCGATPVIACEARDRQSLSSIDVSVDRQWIEQGSGPFGSRVAGAVVEAFARGFDTVLVAAIDAPPPHDLSRVLAELRNGVAVLAPARDGGVNFIGLTRPEAALLECFAPQRADLFELCRRHLPDAAVFEAVTDIDTSASLTAAAREREWQGFLPSTHHGTDGSMLLGRGRLPTSHAGRAPPS